ncbi:MAG: metallophosphoesterase [Candidatus Aenigmarchaeota archaeon]|nr:metallophosphoesterase [Candidatus Aenigmarchaeota archaeon]
MKIGIISDTHDHVDNIRKVIDKMKKYEVEAIIHCGDFCSPFAVEMMKEFNVPVHAVFGNVDGDKFRMLMKKPENVTLHGEFVEIELGGKKIAIVHFPEIAKALAFGGKYDLVCYGHTHVSNVEKIENTLLVNPGELMNLKGLPSYAIYDTISNEVKIMKLS